MKYVGLPLALENELKNALILKGDYSVWGTEHHSLALKLKEHAKTKYDINLTFDKLGSIRRVYMRDKFIKRYRLLEPVMPKILIDYASMDILDISKKYDFPPLAIMRHILLHVGFTKEQIKKITKDPNLLDGRHKEQFLIAVKSDYIGDFEQDKIVEGANNFEKTIENFFDNRHIPYRTQADLARDQIQLIQRAVITPDLYFPRGVMVSGKKLYWIDAKNYYGGNVSYVYNSMIKQATKYTKMYGRGAFIFKHGFSEALSKRVDAVFIEW